MAVQQISNSFVVSVDGRDVPDGVALDSVEVHHDLHLPDSFVLVLRDVGRTALERAKVSIGAEVVVKVVSDAGAEALVSGEVTAVEATFGGGLSQSVVRGYDESHRLFRGRSTTAFQNMTYSDIAKKVATRAGLDVGTVESTSPAHEHVTQANESDWSFLSRLAGEIGYEVSVRNRTLHFRSPPDATKAPAPGDLEQEDALRLTVGSNLLSLEASVSAAEQVEEVQVRGWDPTSKQPLVAERAVTTESVDNASNSAAVAAVFPAPAVVSVGVPHRGPDEVELAARAISERIAASHTEMEGVARGNPRLRAGVGVRLELAGDPFDGSYVLTSTVHRYDPIEGYTTAFVVSGRQRRSLLQLTGGTRDGATEPVRGAVTAIVEDANDPDRLHRVRLRFPWLDDAYVSDWCRVALPGAGENRGWTVLPEPGDEVLVCFEQGDIRRPYVLGGLHNNCDPPDAGFSPVVDPNSGAVNGRSFRSRSGHLVSIVDDRDGTGISLSTADDSLRIHLDQAGRKIAISSGGQLTIDVDGDLAMSAGGDLDIRAGGDLGIDASGAVKVRGRQIDLN